jgi:hypothetical protein
VSSVEPTITRESGAPDSLEPTAAPEAEEAAVAADDGRPAGGHRRPAAPGGRGGRPARWGVPPTRPAGGRAEPADQFIVQPGVRTILVRQATWRATADLEEEERRRPGTLAAWKERQHTAWYRRRRIRELVLLTMLYEHRHLTTEHLRALFFPSLRVAQLHLRWLAVEQRLVMRWPHYEPVVTGPGPAPAFWGLRQRSSVFLLTDLGAALVAEHRKLDHKAAVRRSYYAAERDRVIEHTLETNGFWVSLAAAARDLPDHGLYHWVGDDSMRRNLQELGTDLAPDGWGRYLVPSGEIRFSLEWDRGTEAPQRLSRKAAAYLARAGGDRSANVLVVVPGQTREASVRGAIARTLPQRGPVRFWSTHLGLLQEQGPLGAIWWEVADGGDQRIPLTQLPARSGSRLRVEDCIGKPGWWERRPGGGEGA